MKSVEKKIKIAYKYNVERRVYKTFNYKNICM